MSENEGRIVINERADLDKAIVSYWRNRMADIMEARKQRGEYIYKEQQEDVA